MRYTKPNLLLFNVHAPDSFCNLWDELFDTRMKYKKRSILFYYIFIQIGVMFERWCNHIKLHLTIILCLIQFGPPLFHINQRCNFSVRCYLKSFNWMFTSPTFVYIENISTDRKSYYETRYMINRFWKH